MLTEQNRVLIPIPASHLDFKSQRESHVASSKWSGSPSAPQKTPVPDKGTMQINRPVKVHAATCAPLGVCMYTYQMRMGVHEYIT